MTPFDRAEQYRALGWTGTIPLPPHEKWPPPAGFTGGAGKWPNDGDLARWRLEGYRTKHPETGELLHHDASNIALRLPPNVAGLDVDQYDGKAGRETLAALEEKLGQLPPTWMSGSRDDGSGIRLYRVPPRLDWPTEAGPNIEIIRHGHRYTVAAPSAHPDTGQAYRWVGPAGAVGDPPKPGDLPELPTGWVAYLTGTDNDGTTSPKPGSRSAQRKDRKAGREWLGKLPAGQPCAYVATLAADLRAATGREDGSAYDHSRDTVMALLRAAERGHRGVPAVLDRGRSDYVAGVAKERSTAVAQAEFDRFTEGGAGKVLAGPSPDAGRGCDCVGAFLTTLDTSAAPPGTDRAHPGAHGGADDEQEPADPLAALDIITASDVELSRVVYVWDARIPRGAMTLMPGEEGIGKTTVGIRIMADLTRGTLPGEHYGTPRDVLVIATEDGLGDVFVPRLREAGADLTRVHIVRARIAMDGTSHEVIVPRDLPVLAEAVRRWDVALVWIDSLVTTLPDELKSISYKDTAKVLKALGHWAETERIAVAAPWHLNKASGSDTAIRIMDSRAFRTAIRSMLLIVGDPEAPEGGPPQGLVALDKANAGTLAVPALRYRIRAAHYVVAEVDDDTGEVHDVAASCGVVEWIGQAEGDGRELARSYLAPRIEKDDEPGTWLREHLTEHGETLRADAMKAGAEAGFSLEQIKRAARRLPVHSREETGQDPQTGRPFRRALWSVAQSVPQSVAIHADAPTAPTGEGSHTPTTPIDAGQAQSVRLVRSVRGAPTEATGATTGETTDTNTGDVLGSCAVCYAPTPRFGDNGSPLCDRCKATADPVTGDDLPWTIPPRPNGSAPTAPTCCGLCGWMTDSPNHTPERCRAGATQ